MSELENIFSKNKIKKEKEDFFEIIIDDREKNSLIPSLLISKNLNISFKRLEIGDYIINDLIIERKTMDDFISSMISSRLKEQIKNLKSQEKTLLILEGENHKHKISSNSIKGTIASIILKDKVGIITTKNEEETANFLKLMAKKKKLEEEKEENIIRPKKKIKNLEEKKSFFLQGLPGIGNKKSKEIIQKFLNISEFLNSSSETLKELNLKDQNIKEIFQILKE